MPRPLVVEGEAAPIVAQPAQPALVPGPAHLRRRRGLARVARPVGGAKRVAGQHVLYVHQQQFLMLLLMIEPELDQLAGRGPGIDGKRVEQPAHRPVHMGAIGDDLGDLRPGQQAAVGTRMPLAHALVIGIEQISESRIEGLVARQVRREDESLEEPGDVSQMPLGGTHVRHRLDLLVLRRKRRGQGLAQSTDFGVALREAGSRYFMVFGMQGRTPPWLARIAAEANALGRATEPEGAAVTRRYRHPRAASPGRVRARAAPWRFRPWRRAGGGR